MILWVGVGRVWTDATRYLGNILNWRKIQVKDNLKNIRLKLPAYKITSNKNKTTPLVFHTQNHLIHSKWLAISTNCSIFWSKDLILLVILGIFGQKILDREVSFDCLFIARGSKKQIESDSEILYAAKNWKQIWRIIISEIWRKMIVNFYFVEDFNFLSNVKYLSKYLKEEKCT